MNNYLYHWGVLGMKWGVRKKRRDDKRVSNMSDEELSNSIKRKSLESTYNKLHKKTSKLESTKKIVDASTGAVNQLQKINRESLNQRPKQRMNLKKMSDQQLRERINRHLLEKQYNDLFNNSNVEVSKGRAYATKILDVSGNVMAVGSSALAIALAIKELRK